MVSIFLLPLSSWALITLEIQPVGLYIFFLLELAMPLQHSLLAEVISIALKQISFPSSLGQGQLALAVCSGLNPELQLGHVRAKRPPA